MCFWFSLSPSVYRRGGRDMWCKLRARSSRRPAHRGLNRPRRRIHVSRSEVALLDHQPLYFDCRGQEEIHYAVNTEAVCWLVSWATGGRRRTKKCCSLLRSRCPDLRNYTSTSHQRSRRASKKPSRAWTREICPHGGSKVLCRSPHLYHSCFAALVVWETDKENTDAQLWSSAVCGCSLSLQFKEKVLCSVPFTSKFKRFTQFFFFFINS